MSVHPTTLRDLTGNPAVETIELRECGGTAGFADEPPRQDADAFPNDELTEREIDALYVAEMERRDRLASAGAGDHTDPTPPAGGRAPLPRETAEYWQDVASRMADAVIIDAIDMNNVEPHRMDLAGVERVAFLDGFTRELLRRLAA